jgi:imidazolonepropionase-like amidohydrolase/predicted enzyme related to lactoylglutathione lyase
MMLKKLVIALLTIIVLSFLAGGIYRATQSRPSKSTFIIKNARVIVGNGDVLPSATVVIKDGRIQDITTQEVTLSGAEVIDAAGKSLMPGIIDTHLHIFYSFEKGEQAYRTLLDNQIPIQMANFLKYGVTTIKSLDDPVSIVLELRQQLHDKKIPGPRLLVVGPDFTAPDGHPAITLASDDPWLRKEMVVEVDDPSQAQEAVRQLASQKIDAIKLIYQGGEMETLNKTVTLQKLSKEIMLAVIDEAHKQNLRATAHVWFEQDAIDALEAGADGLEHGLVGVSLMDDRLVQLLKEKKAFYVPTLQILETSANKELLPIGEKNLKVMSDDGVLIALGTDTNCSFQTGGEATIHEMELMQQAGMTPDQIITAATSNAAQHLGLLNEIGTVEVGKIADLILVDGDPTKDISAVKNVLKVFQAGTIAYDSTVAAKSADGNQNAVTWFDIPVNDIDRAKAFYETVLNVKLFSLNLGDIKFASFPEKSNGAGASGWLIQNKSLQPSGQGTVIYFAVDDMDAAINRIQVAGGTILQPKMKMGQLGYICLFQDTEGNTVGLRSSK